MDKMFLYKDAKGNVYKLSEKKAAALGFKNKIGPAKDRRLMKDDESTPGRIMDLDSAKGESEDESDQTAESVPSDAPESDPKPKKKNAKNKKREVEPA